MDMSTVLGGGRYLGVRTRTRRVGRFRSTETSYTPGMRLPRHTHEQAYLTYVLRGGYTEDSAAGSRDCMRGTVIFHPAGEWHSDHFARWGGQCLNLDLPASVLPRSHESLGGVSCTGDVEWAATRLWHEFRRSDRVSALAVEELVQVLVGELARKVAPAPLLAPPRWLGTVTEFINANVRSEMTLDDVATAGGVHPMHLVRAFKQRHGCTVGEYVRRRRIEWACAQLANRQLHELTLSRLAIEAGFTDHAHFTRVFKRVTGMTPSAYRSYLLPTWPPAALVAFKPRRVHLANVRT